MPILRPAIFLDRDGTINADVDYLHSPDQLHLLPGSGEALFRLQKHFALVVVTNQSGIARGILKEEDLIPIHRRLDEMLRPFHVAIDRYYYCPHHPDFGEFPYRQDCPCRKPKPFLFRRAAQELGLDLCASWGIGDRLRDCQGPLELGCRSILLTDDVDKKSVAAQEYPSLLFARDLSEAADIILGHPPIHTNSSGSLPDK